MKIFRHFKTLKQVRAYMKETDPYSVQRLVYRKKKGKHAKPYTVGSQLDFLHFA